MSTVITSQQNFEAGKSKGLQDAGKSAFDLNKHRSPQLDTHGQIVSDPRKQNLNPQSLQDVKLPSWWKQSPSKDKKTLTGLQDERKEACKPHISYDLDGDGQVSSRDFVLAKLFDLDKDGKLNTKEKSNALEAIKNGIENDFYWNTQSASKDKQFRLLQKRGVIIESENFNDVQNTYPEHQVSKKKADIGTKNELDQKRRQDNKNDINNKFNIAEQIQNKYKQESALPAFMPGENYVQNPRYQSIKQRKEEEKQQVRAKAGLTDIGTHVGTDLSQKNITTKYVDRPAVNAQSTVKQNRKDAMLNDLKKIEPNFETHKDAQSRILDREMCHLRIAAQKEPSKNVQQIRDSRKEQDIKAMTKKFGTVTIGVHGQELPKFNDANETWWQLKGQNEQPKFNSRIQLKQSQQFWAANDSYKVADSNKDQAPQDEFKTVYQAKMIKNDIPEKVQDINHCKDEDLLMQVNGEILNVQRFVGFSDSLSKYKTKQDNRIFDDIIQNNHQLEEKEIDRQKNVEIFKKSMAKGHATSVQIDGQDQVFGASNMMSPQRVNNKKESQKNHEVSRTALNQQVSPNQGVNAGSMSHRDQRKTSFDGSANGTQTVFSGKSTLFSRMNYATATATQHGTQTEKIKKPIFNEAKPAKEVVKPMNQSNMTTVHTKASTGFGNQCIMTSTSKGNQDKSPFKDAVQRGVLSGNGMLTF